MSDESVTRLRVIVGTACAPAPDMLEHQLELLCRFREGDPTALAQVYQGYRGDVERLARRGFVLKGPRALRIRGLRDDDDVHDTVQEVFAKAFTERARRAYDGRRPYGPYLMQITKNVRIDQERRRWREVLVADSGAASCSLSGATERCWTEPREQTPEEALGRQRTRQKVVFMIATLEPALQQLYVLRFVEELSQDEAARQMAVTRRHARTLEQRVMGGIRRQFAGEWAA